METEGYIKEAGHSLDQAEAKHRDFAHIYSLKGIGLALIAIARELKLANDLKMWEAGVGPNPNPDAS